MLSKLKLIVWVCFVVACRRQYSLPLQYDNGSQILSVNELSSDGKAMNAPVIGKTALDSVAVGEELVVKIFLSNDEFHVVNAFMDCDTARILVADTTTLKIDGCSRQLFVESDTVFIGFRPSEPGVHIFPDIVLLTQDERRVLRSYPYAFQYKVFAK